MPKSSKDIDQTPPHSPEKPRFPRMLTLTQVNEILNVGMPTISALLSSGELRGLQLGGRRYLEQLVAMQRSLPVFRGQAS